jgi:hypothetical protein
MWKWMLTEKKYIDSKMFGDGFGYSQEALRTLLIARVNGTLRDEREMFMLQGAVHSGPVSTIKYAGYIGLALFYCLLFATAKRALQIMLKSKGTPFAPMAYFWGIGALLHPLTFTFIFGAYEVDLPRVFLTVGLLRAVEDGLAEYKATLVETEEATEIQSTLDTRRKALIGAPAQLGA